jgi:general secretion pathway protein G
MTRNSGFTLVEILIVVIILGILAAIIIPQFTEASNDARQSALKSDLQTIRSQLELYKVQHQDHYPNMVCTNGTWAADNSTANFVSRLTGTTDVSGVVGNTGFGPYMQKFPTNSLASANASSVAFQATGAAPTPDGDPGWIFDTSDGKVYVNITGNDSSGTAFVAW